MSQIEVRSIVDAVEKKEKKEKGERRERKVMTCGAHLHMSSTLAKPPFKTSEWPNVNGFRSSMVEDFWFRSWIAKLR